MMTVVVAGFSRAVSKDGIDPQRISHVGGHLAGRCLHTEFSLGVYPVVVEAAVEKPDVAFGKARGVTCVIKLPA